ncbi:MAG: hypothetical protein R3336_01710 [Phycisphaeraceae bacterium]|nr:hypothetical protein [Phycisphaeraceae bacterium]
MSAGQMQGQGGGRGGTQAGTRAGGPVLGQTGTHRNYRTQVENERLTGDGRVIASWQSEGEVARGEAKIQYQQAASEARKDAERAIDQGELPRRYHGAVRRYFDQLPADPGTPAEDPADAPPRAPQ